MRRPEFEDLPFDDRPDLTPYLIHLTKNTAREDQYSADDNLSSILRTGKIWGSDSERGFIKGPHTATCFMDIPFVSLKYLLDDDNAAPDKPRYEPYGVVVGKKLAYASGCRPVLYLSDAEVAKLSIPSTELWRVVRFEMSDEGCISWLHEREWRCRGDFRLPRRPLAVLVKNTKAVARLQKQIEAAPEEFKAIPRSIVPLSIVCQGLTRLS